MLVRYILSKCVSVIKSIVSVMFYAIYGVVCIQLIHLSYGDCENTCTLSYYHHQIRSVSHLPLFRSWNNGMRCMSFYILIEVIPYRYEWIGSVFTLIFLAWNMSWCVVSIFFLINCHFLQHYTTQSALTTFLQKIISCENISTWWRHQMETFSTLLAICAGNSPVTDEFPSQRPVTQSFDVFFDLRLNKRSSKQSWGWWFETLSCPLWRHCNDHNLLPNFVGFHVTHF